MKEARNDKFTSGKMDFMTRTLFAFLSPITTSPAPGGGGS